VSDESSSTLRDNLLALPLWAPLIAFGLLAVGVGVGFTLLLVPNLSDALRGAGGQLLVISLPVLALLVGLLGASWAHTKRIDGMVAAYLRRTVGDKLHAYLVGSPVRDDEPNPYPPLFVTMDRMFRKDIASYCQFRLIDDRDRQFDVLVKCNVFNFEIALRLQLAEPPSGFQPDMPEQSYGATALESWASVSTEPLVALVSSTIHGSLAEGYTVYIHTEPAQDGALDVTYRLRQRLETNFLTSPYLRRYFSEDAAIACYFFFVEARANRKVEILGGRA
jgi:hypothetical protein